MPYITSENKTKLAHRDNQHAETVGELTYLLYKLCLQYIKDKGVGYQIYAEVLGALSATSRELYRKEVAVYEDEKIQMNGDVK